MERVLGKCVSAHERMSAFREGSCCAMIQKTTSIPAISPDDLSPNAGSTVLASDQPDQLASVWVSRITGIGGGFCLLVALSYWFLRPGHYRPVLILLTVAMFASILHSYVFENGERD